mmetsp:Transcript_32142/g.81108  ORF Transcript_32142/g.81108 Transcript_32142/m.81108 type:complete len:254 (+) Transcript_32142:71-832(+)
MYPSRGELRPVQLQQSFAGCPPAGPGSARYPAAPAAAPAPPAGRARPIPPELASPRAWRRRCLGMAEAPAWMCASHPAPRPPCHASTPPLAPPWPGPAAIWSQAAAAPGPARDLRPAAPPRSSPPAGSGRLLPGPAPARGGRAAAAPALPRPPPPARRPSAPAQSPCPAGMGCPGRPAWTGCRCWDAAAAAAGLAGERGARWWSWPGYLRGRTPPAAQQAPALLLLVVRGLRAPRPPAAPLAAGPPQRGCPPT